MQKRGGRRRRHTSSYRHEEARKKKKQVGWSVSLRKRRTEKPIESRRKKQECVFSIIGKYRLLFLRKFIFCCKYFNFLFVGCLNFEFTFICQLRGSYRRPSRSLSLSISTRSNGGYLPPSIYISPFLSIVVVPSSLPTDKIHLLKNPQNNNKNNNNEYTIKKRTERECCSATSDISVKLKENKSY